MDTSTPGAHVYTVTATSQCGESSSTSVSYTVAAPTTTTTTSTTPATTTTAPTPTPPTATGPVPSPLPSPSPVVVVTPGRVGLTYQLSAARSHTAGAPIVSYRWTLDGRPIGSGATIQHTFPTANHTYEVRVVLIDSRGQSSSETIRVTPHARIQTVRLTVRFALDRADLNARERRALARLRPLFARGQSVTIDGYCAAREVHRNRLLTHLSNERARSVLRFLRAGEKTSAARIVVRGHGASNFVAANTTATGRAHNRRATLIIRYQKPIR